jgi:hypothetical protein
MEYFGEACLLARQPSDSLLRTAITVVAPGLRTAQSPRGSDTLGAARRHALAAYPVAP